MRSTQINSIAGHLTAANLFGYQPEKQLPEPELTQNSVMAVYPAINDEAFARTMDNYRQYVSDYNYRTMAENEVIERHNSAVQIYKKNNQLAHYELQIIENFKRFEQLPAREYNKEVDNAGDAFKRFLEKKRIHTIKYATEQIFQNMLYLYQRQLKARNDEYMRLAVKTPRPLQELEINAYQVTTIKRNDIFSLDICNKTVRNHRQRMEEAGVLIDYTFCGSKRGVKCHINPQILVVFDIFTNKIAVAENQSVTSDCGKVLPNSNEITGAIIEKYKKTEYASQSSCDKVCPPDTGSLHYRNNFYGNTGSKLENSPGAPPSETVKISKTLSESLRDHIIHPQELAMELAAGAFDNYKPIDIRLLYQEAYNGQLTRSEFRELVIQDFFKSSAKLYRNSNVYVGSWKNAINHWMNREFKNWQGVEFQKHNIVDDVVQLRWRLEQARKFFNRTGIQPLYPSNYFDPTRKNSSKEIGFAFTIRHWKRHQEYVAGLQNKQRSLQRNAEARLKNINNAKKYEDQVRRFLKNKITWPQLADYVRNNLPAEYYRKLPEVLNTMLTHKL